MGVIRPRRACLRRQWEQSTKLAATMDVLRDVQARGEKAIVFAMSKDLQLLLAMWARFELGVQPAIINGDTAATSGGAARSRKQLIADFEAVEGFNVIIMSPIAAGVGLTVVGANHVIHLERHWNPAKEAQRTDRVHRTGQKRDVHVHLPAATHPDLESFDVLLDRLLTSKLRVRDAVMAPGVVSEGDVLAAFGGSSGPPPRHNRGTPWWGAGLSHKDIPPPGTELQSSADNQPPGRPQLSWNVPPANATINGSPIAPAGSSCQRATRARSNASHS